MEEGRESVTPSATFFGDLSSSTLGGGGGAHVLVLEM